MTIKEQIEIVESHIAEYGVCDITIEEYKYLKQQIRADAIDEFAKLVWGDIEARYKNDIKVLGYLSADNLLRDVHNSICYFAEQLKEQK